jgi:hypothetical protein
MYDFLHVIQREAVKGKHDSKDLREKSRGNLTTNGAS